MQIHRISREAYAVCTLKVVLCQRLNGNAGTPEESTAGIQLKNGEEDQEENIGSCRIGCEQRGRVNTETSDWS